MSEITDTESVQPFRIDIPQRDVDDLRDRLVRTRWPRDLEEGWGRGVPVGYLRPIAEYWRDEFDWRAQEARLNELPQFTTTVDGQLIHFVHIRSTSPDARPLLMVHGWPSSFVEFLDVIGRLTDPVAHGGRAEMPCTSSSRLCPDTASRPSPGRAGAISRGWRPRSRR
jgi:hypothetical protein